MGICARKWVMHHTTFDTRIIAQGPGLALAMRADTPPLLIVLTIVVQRCVASVHGSSRQLSENLCSKNLSYSFLQTPKIMVLAMSYSEKEVVSFSKRGKASLSTLKTV